jgi:hypothetical protein
MNHGVTCDSCGKEFEREIRRINEAESNGWKQYCSSECLRKSKLTGKMLICDNPKCKKKFYRPLKEFFKSRKHFCSSHCSAVVNNLERGLKSKRKCFNDGCIKLVFKYKKFCSNECFQEYRKKKFLPKYKQSVLVAIKKFVKQNGRIPFKQEMNKFYRPARIAFGSWNKAVKEAGFIPNKLMFTRKFMANDGHICDSLAEKIIDDWLSARKVKHQINVLYPGERRLTTDFKVKDCWIEFFGLSGQHKRYDELMTEKLMTVKRNKLHLISIYPKDLCPKSRLDQLLNRLLDSKK